MDKPTTSLTADWVQCESKNRPGQYYMFNKKTGETKWCAGTKPIAPKKTISATDIVNTPAQDRLKRLQDNLQSPDPNMTSPSKGNSDRQSKEADTSGAEKPKVPEVKKNRAANNGECSKAITSRKIGAPKRKSSLEQTKVNVVSSKRPLSKPTEIEDSSEPKSKRKFIIPKKPPNRSESSTRDLQITSAMVGKTSETSIRQISTSTILNTEKMAVKGGPGSRYLKQNAISHTDVHRTGKSSIDADRSRTSSETSNFSGRKLNHKGLLKPASESDVNDNNDNEKQLKGESKPGLISTLKGFYDKLMNKATKPKKRKPPENKDKEKMSNISSNSKPSFKQRKPDNTSVIRGVLLENDNASKQKQQSPLQLNVSPIIRTVSLPIPVPNISANDRLQRLRNSLHLQQNNIQNLPATSFASSKISDVSNSIDYENVSTSDCEPMDWQPITEECSTTVVSSSSLPIARAANSSSPSEHYGTVNENLLRLAAHKKQNKKWKTDHFYFVVDTNVFINSLTFVDELIQMKLCDTIGTVIYVPYCVLQELDKLKIRSPSESVKIRSARAIKFLNKCFEDKQQHIQAQSAADETQHLIQVTSPDDSILNCCLQVKKYVDNMLLLTEDNNLQNKALCSDILVSTKSDLISKHESLL